MANEPKYDAEKALETLQKLNAERKARELVETWNHTQPLRNWVAHGLRCMVLQGPNSINGYVIVPESHPWYKVNYCECPKDCDKDWCEHTPEHLIEVHGGITFSRLVTDGWCFGFDTAHSGDYMVIAGSVHEGRRWTVDGVAVETELMAKQLAEVT